MAAESAKFVHHLTAIADLASEMRQAVDVPIRAWMQLLNAASASGQAVATLTQAHMAVRCYTHANIDAIQQCSADRLRPDVPLEHTGVLVKRITESRCFTQVDPSEIELQIQFGIPVRHILQHANRSQQIRLWTYLIELLLCAPADQTIAATLMDTHTKLTQIAEQPVPDASTASPDDITNILQKIAFEQKTIAATTGSADLTSTKEYQAVVKGLTQFMPKPGEPNVQEAMELVSMVQGELGGNVDFSTFMKSIATVAGGLMSHGQVDQSNPSINMFSALMNGVQHLPMPSSSSR